MMHQMIKEMARMKVLKLTFRMFTVRAKSRLRDTITDGILSRLSDTSFKASFKHRKKYLTDVL